MLRPVLEPIRDRVPAPSAACLPATTAARVPAMPDEGSSTRRMKGFSAAPSVLLAVCLFVLGGCAELAALDINPFNFRLSLPHSKTTQTVQYPP